MSIPAHIPGLAMSLLVMALLPLTSAFPSGAHNNGSNPMDALSSYCTAGNYRPNHGSYLPQSSASPYIINAMSPVGHMYSPGKPVIITIEGRQMDSNMKPLRKIKGFFLQGDATESAFAGDIVCDHGQGKKVTFCSKQGVTHTNGRPKDRIVCRWSPPDFQLGHVQFTATVLENFTDFWTGVKSEQNLISDPNTMTYSQKAQQLSQQMMQKFQGSAANILNMFRTQNAGGNAGWQSNTGAANQRPNPTAAFTDTFQNFFKRN